MQRPTLRRGHFRLLALLSALLVAVILLSTTDEAEATRATTERVPAEPLQAAQPVREQLAIPAVAKAQPHDNPSVHPVLAPKAIPEADGDKPVTAKPAADSATPPALAPTVVSVEAKPWQTVSVHRGDTLSGIFHRLGLGASDVHAVLASGDHANQLKRLMPGETLHFDISNGRLRALQYKPGPLTTVAITREGDSFSSSLQKHPADIRVNHAGTVIHNSLYAAGQKAGLSDNIIMEFADIFGWDVDFAHDIRPGDHFTVIYNSLYRNGEKLRDGDILAAEFVVGGKTYRAVRYDDGNYYTPDGKSMRKAFLRSPVDFRRISSRFAKQRCHPILGVCRPHMGVDFAAATGTPIKASGDGKIIFRGWKGGYGRAIILAHGNHITTLYGHMSKFRGGLRAGSHVRQGQIIGYVGMSGLATGPHLHYEFRVNGVHHDPLKVKLPQAKPIRADAKQDFLKQARPLLAQLDTLGQSLVAMNRP